MKRGRHLAAIVGVAAGIAAGGCFVSLGEPSVRPSIEAGADGDAESGLAPEAGVAVCPGASDPDLVGYWQFEDDESSKTVKDCTSNHLDGKIVNVTNLPRVAGHSGKALDFDGKAGCVDLGEAPALAFTAAEFSVSAWVFVRTFGQGVSPRIFPRIVLGRQVYSIPDDTYLGWGVGSGSQSTTELKIFPGGSGTDSDVVNTVVPPRVFTHVVGVRTKDELRFYLNGVAGVPTTTTRQPANPPSAHGLIGCRVLTVAELPFDGLIDELRVYKRALTPAEIVALSKQ